MDELTTRDQAAAVLAALLVTQEPSYSLATCGPPQPDEHDLRRANQILDVLGFDGLTELRDSVQNMVYDGHPNATDWFAIMCRRLDAIKAHPISLTVTTETVGG